MQKDYKDYKDKRDTQNYNVKQHWTYKITTSRYKLITKKD